MFNKTVQFIDIKIVLTSDNQKKGIKIEKIQTTAIIYLHNTLSSQVK